MAGAEIRSGVRMSKKTPPRPGTLPPKTKKAAKKRRRKKPRRASGDGWELVLQDAWEGLKGDTCDHIICDPPFSARTHAGQRHGRRTSSEGRDAHGPGWCSETGLGYSHLTHEQVASLCPILDAASRGWIIVMTDHVLFPVWEREFLALDRYMFAPVPVVIPGMNVRLAGDGPSNWTIWLVVTRPRGLKDGTKPGAYLRPAEDPRRSKLVKGAKPLSLMDQLVRDYSQPGQTICDPFAGSGTTGVATLRNAREFIGFEINADHFNQAEERLTAAVDPLFPRHVLQGAQESLI